MSDVPVTSATPIEEVDAYLARMGIDLKPGLARVKKAVEAARARTNVNDSKRAMMRSFPACQVAEGPHNIRCGVWDWRRSRVWLRPDGGQEISPQPRLDLFRSCSCALSEVDRHEQAGRE